MQRRSTFWKRRRPARISPFRVRRRTRLQWKRYKWIGVGLAGVVLLFLIILWPPWMYLKPGNVTGPTTRGAQLFETAAEHLETRSLIGIKRSHKWFFRKSKLEERLTDTYALSRIEITRKGGALQIDAADRITTYYLVRGDVMHIVDDNGVIAETVEDLDRVRIELESQQGTGTIPVVDDNRADAERYNPALSEDQRNTIAQAVELIDTTTLLTPLRASLDDDPTRVDISTDAGVTIYLSTERPVDQQIHKLQTLVERDLVDISGLRYIDLRFKNRLFYN